MEEVEEAAEHEAGADEQHAGEADFCHDQRIAQAILVSACRWSREPTLETVFGIGARGLKRRGEAEEDSGGRR